MKALVYPDWDALEIREVPEPLPGPGEVVIAVAAVGICGSEIEAFVSRSPRRTPPLILGHEFCGEVVAAGEGVSGWAPGDRVAVNSLITCGRCPACLDGLSHLCPGRGVFGMSRPGAFAELLAVPEGCLVPLPEKISPIQGALVEPLANAVHVFGLIRERFPETVVVIGAGTIGLLCLQVARGAGALRRVAVDTNDARLEIAHGLGAEPVFNPSREAVGPAVREFTRGRGADVVIDAVGTADTRRMAVAATRPGGAAVWIGLHADATEISGHDVVLGERAVLGSYAVTPRDLRTAIGLFAHGRIEIKPWVRPFPLEEGARVFRQLATAPPRDFIKALLLP